MGFILICTAAVVVGVILVCYGNSQDDVTKTGTGIVILGVVLGAIFVSTEAHYNTLEKVKELTEERASIVYRLENHTEKSGYTSAAMLNKALDDAAAFNEKVMLSKDCLDNLILKQFTDPAYTLIDTIDIYPAELTERSNYNNSERDPWFSDEAASSSPSALASEASSTPACACQAAR